MVYVKTDVVARRNARGGRSAEEHLVAALRCLYRPQPPRPPRQATLTATDPATPPVRCPRSFGRGAGVGIGP